MEHTVKKGETLYSISRQYNISKDEILNNNPNASNILSIGDIIRIPENNNNKVVKDSDSKVSSIPEDKKYYYHCVEKNESLSDIARFYHIKTRKIKKANSFLKKRDLVESDTLRIPKKDIRDIELVSRLIKERFSSKIVVDQLSSDTLVLDKNVDCGAYEYHIKADTIDIALFLPFYLYENDTLGMSDTLLTDNES